MQNITGSLVNRKQEVQQIEASGPQIVEALKNLGPEAQQDIGLVKPPVGYKHFVMKANVPLEIGKNYVFKVVDQNDRFCYVEGYAGKAITLAGQSIPAFDPDGTEHFLTYTELLAAMTAAIQQSQAPVALTYASTMAPDFATARNRELLMTGNGTLANPTNQVAGQSGYFLIKQDGTGSRTLAYGANFKFPGGVDPALSTAANAVDMLCYSVHAVGEVYSTLLKGLA